MKCLNLILLMFMFPAVVQAELLWVIENNAITITGCTGTESAVIIPAEIMSRPVVKIRNNAFSSNLTLTSITIPHTVTNIDVTGFAGSTNLATFTVDSSNPAYSSAEGILFNKYQTTLFHYPPGKGGTDYTVPSGVTNIENRGFSHCASLVSVAIPSDTISIGPYAFYRCTGLSSITIPDSVTSLGANVFYACGSLTNATVGNAVTTIELSAFYSCSSLVRVTLGSSVTNLANYAFGSCGNLTDVEVPNSVINIGSYAFSYCGNLTNAVIGSGVTNIGGAAFYNCTQLGEVYFRGNAPNVTSYSFNYTPATVYYLPGTTNWGPTYAGRPTALWLPRVPTADSSFGVSSNQFGFNVRWASGMTIVVEACTNLADAVWSPLQTNSLAADSFYFSDPDWTDYPARLYRIRSP